MRGGKMQVVLHLTYRPHPSHSSSTLSTSPVTPGGAPPSPNQGRAIMPSPRAGKGDRSRSEWWMRSVTGEVDLAVDKTTKNRTLKLWIMLKMTKALTMEK